MSLLSVQQLSFGYCLGSSLLAKVNFNIQPGDRIGLAGPNGSGKTTLLRLLAGDLEATSGSVVRRRGMSMFVLERPAAQLSSGERTREALAALMREPADLYLLDEPTNHLDSDGRRWLAQWLVRQKVTCVIVSHDRYFLNEVTNRTLMIERGSVHYFAGTYDFALQQHAEDESTQRSEYDSQQRRVAAAEQAAERRAKLAAKVAKAPPGVRQCRDFYGRKAGKVARTGRLLRERQQHEPDVKKPWEEQAIPHLDFSRVPYCPELLMHSEELVPGYDEPLSEPLTFAVHRGDRWAFAGPNGSGKTTLFRTLIGDLPAIEGRFHWSAGSRLGYYSQEHEQLDLRQTPLESCMAVCIDEAAVRTMLACLKLRPELVRQRLSTLSPGERSKTALVQMLLGRFNVLILDEPTNHLEMEAQAALAEALRQFPGAILFASHDRWFSDEVATRTVRLRAPSPEISNCSQLRLSC